MGLITVFFMKGKSDEYRKAIVDSAELDFFIGLGAVTTPTQTGAKGDADGLQNRQKEQKERQEKGQDPTTAPGQIEEIKAIDPAKGHGKPGSFDFHKNCILDFNSVPKISDYLEQVTGKALAGTIKKIETARTAAIIAVREYLTNGG